MHAVLPAVALRPVTAADDDLLLAVYAAARADELDQVAWSPGQREAFVGMQHGLQARQYAATYRCASHDVVEVDGRPAGRLYVDRPDHEIRVVDLALLPHARGCGVGSALLRGLQEEGRASGRPVTLHVELPNVRAAVLYERLGFRPVAERGVRRMLAWSAP